VEYINIIIGLAAFFVALRALNLQREEIIKNGRISALMHTSNLLQERIDYHMKIADDNNTSHNWKERHKNKVNHKLRPLKSTIDFEFIKLASMYDDIIHEDKLKELLKSEKKIDS